MFLRLLKSNKALFLPLLLCSLAFTIPKLVQSQDTTNRPVYTEWNTIERIHGNPDSWIPIDTAIDFLQRYNPIYQRGEFRKNLGNMGSPTFSLKFQPFTDGSFYTGLDHYDIYQYEPSSLKHYNTYTPFTHIKFNQRFSGDQQDLSGVHTRNINPFWNFGIRFTRNNSRGIYLNQETDQTRIGLNTHFQTANGRYQGYLSGVLNNLSQQENGGIESFLNFRDLEGDDRSRASVKLDQAKERYYFRSLQYDHFLFTGPSSRDTVYKNNDTFIRESVDKELYFHHKINFSQTAYGYSQQNLRDHKDFYPAINLDSTETRDSFVHNTLSNEFAISNYSQSDSSRDLPFSFRTGIEWNLHQYGQNDERTLFQNLRLKGDITVPFDANYLKVHSQFFPIGRYQGDFKSHQKLRMRVDSYSHIDLGHKIQQRHPSLLKNTMRSNHLQWDNQLDNLLINRFYGHIDHEKAGLDARIQYTLVNNYPYYSKSIAPKQQKKPIHHISSELGYEYQVGNFHLTTDFIFQQFPENEGLVNLPDWAIENSFYYQNEFYKGNLLLATGIDFRYNKPYYADRYFPEYNIFYWQDDQQVGGYPVFDVFMNFRIKRFRGFLKVQHVNKGLSGDNYLLSPDYPLFPRVFTLGIRWMFFD